MLRLGLLRAFTSSAQTPILPIKGILAVTASAEGVVGLMWTDVLSGSLPAVLVAVEPLKRRRVADTDRVGRGALGGKAPSLFVGKLLALPTLFGEGFVLRAGSLGVSAGGDIKATLAVWGMDEVVTAVLSVAVVGGPNVGLAGAFRRF